MGRDIRQTTISELRTDWGRDPEVVTELVNAVM